MDVGLLGGDAAPGRPRHHRRGDALLSALRPPLPAVPIPERWALCRGVGDDWRAARALQTERSFRLLAAAGEKLGGAAPPARRALLRGALARLEAAPERIRARLAEDPRFDALCRLSPAQSPALAREDWESQCAAAAAAAALLSGEDAELEAPADRRGRLEPPGLAWTLDFGPRSAGRPLRLRVRGGRLLRARGPSGPPVRRPLAPVLGPVRADAEGAVVRSLYPSPERLEAPSPAFRRTAARALSAMRECSPEAAEEVLGLLRLLVPLKTDDPNTSLSSSISALRGVVYLSHHDDLFLQFETLLHEFCHQKLFLLSELAEILEPGQDAPRLLSPWRPDPRPPRGLLLGAHAFVNVAARLLELERSRPLEGSALRGHQGQLCRRFLQCREALETLDRRARTTAFGRAFLAALAAELGRLEPELRRFPRGAWDHAERSCAEHRRAHEGSPGLHRAGGAAA